MLSDVRTALAAIAGESNISFDPGELHAYGIDGCEPGIVLRPSSAAEISEILRYCAEAKLAAVVAGAGTKLRIGRPPARYDMALSTSRMDRVLAYDPGDLTLGVEAGVPLCTIQCLLAQHHQFLPLAVPFSGQTTIGGTVASGIDSPLRQRYGSAREFLLGMEFVTGDGTAARAGGRVVKNVAGYDLHKLLIGSLGTLGAITRLNFKTFPLPDAFAGYVAAFSDEAGALELAGRLRRSQLEPSAIEVLSPPLAERVAGALLPARIATVPEPGEKTAAAHSSPSAPSGLVPANHWLTLAGYGGSQAVLKRYARDLDRMAAETDAAQAVALEPDLWQGIWAMLCETIPLMLRSAPCPMVAKASVLPARLKPMLAAARDAAQSRGLKVALAARAVGVIYAAFLAETADEESLARLALAAGEWMDAAAAAEGFAWVPWCPAGLKNQIEVWGREPQDLSLMRTLKAVFDPGAVLSPGRFAGGI